jgi:hypothetical protein
MLRAEPAVFGPVVCDPTVSSSSTPSPPPERKLCGRSAPRAPKHASGRAWQLASRKAPDADGAVTVDLYGVLVLAHSDKEEAAWASRPGPPSAPADITLSKSVDTPG